MDATTGKGKQQRRGRQLRLLGGGFVVIAGLALAINGIVIPRLEHQSETIVEASADSVDPADEGKMVHLSGIFEMGPPSSDSRHWGESTWRLGRYPIRFYLYRARRLDLTRTEGLVSGDTASVIARQHDGALTALGHAQICGLLCNDPDCPIPREHFFQNIATVPSPELAFSGPVVYLGTLTTDQILRDLAGGKPVPDGTRDGFVRDAAADAIDPANDGKIVHVVGVLRETPAGKQIGAFNAEGVQRIGGFGSASEPLPLGATITVIAKQQGNALVRFPIVGEYLSHGYACVLLPYHDNCQYIEVLAGPPEAVFHAFLWKGAVSAEAMLDQARTAEGRK